MRSVNDHLNEAKKDRMSNDELFAIYDKLEKGDEVKIDYESSYSGLSTGVFTVTKGKTKVGKAKVERITLINNKNPKGMKYYFYNRSSVSFAMGDMGASLVKIEKI